MYRTLPAAARHCNSARWLLLYQLHMPPTIRASSPRSLRACRLPLPLKQRGSSATRPRKAATCFASSSPPDTRVAPHVHPNDENVTVISGTLHIGFGDKFDQSKGQAVKPGGFALAPKGVQHYGPVRRRSFSCTVSDRLASPTSIPPTTRERSSPTTGGHQGRCCRPRSAHGRGRSLSVSKPDPVVAYVGHRLRRCSTRL